MKMNCRKCGGEHEIFYLNGRNGVRHMVMKCDKVKSGKTTFLKRIDGLKIPEVISKGLKKESLQQPKLL